MIDEIDLARGGGERAQVVEVRARAGDAPCGVGELLLQLPLRRRPDVLGVRGERPAEPADHRGVAGDGSGRVEVVRVDPVDVGGKLAREHAGLAEASAAVDRAVAPQIGAERLQGARETGLRLRPSPPARDARRIVLQIFGKVEDVGCDLAVQVVDFALGRVAERDDELRDPALFQTQDLLRDKGLREARIALHDRGDPVHVRSAAAARLNAAIPALCGMRTVTFSSRAARAGV